jgi:REP element-mobilizing transposase RayT
VPRLPRKELPDGIYHVTSRGVDRMAIFRDDIDREGHVFQGRYGVHVIQDEEYLQSAVDYVLANPVRAGLVERPEDWPWARGPLR